MLSNKIKVLIPILALLLLTAAYQLYVPAPAVLAHITLEVNPALVMTVDSENKIISVELKEGTAQDLFTEADLTGMSLDQALKIIAGQLKEAGFLNDEDKVLLTVHPAEGAAIDNITIISEQLHEAFDSYLEQLQVETPVEIIVLDHALYNAARKAGLWPSDYVVLIADGAPSETIAELVKIKESAGLSGDDIGGHHYKIFEAYMDMRAVGLTEAEALEIINKASAIASNSTQVYKMASGFADMQEAGISFADAVKIFDDFSLTVNHNNLTKEIYALTSDLIDLHEAGITGEEALTALGMAVTTGRNLKEVSKIISALIDLKEAGLPEAEALALVQKTIADDPSLKNLDDLFESEDKEDQEYQYCDDCDDDDKPGPDKTKNCSCDCDDNDDKRNRQDDKRNKGDCDDDKYVNDNLDEDRDGDSDDEQNYDRNGDRDDDPDDEKDEDRDGDKPGDLI